MGSKHCRASREAARDERIEAHVIQSARILGVGVATAWRKYLDANTTFPFVATWTGAGTAPFVTGAKLLVVGFGKDEGDERSLRAKVMDGQKSVQVPLALLVPEDTQADALDAVRDWHYWMRRDSGK